MADQWFVRIGGTEQGPMSPKQLRELVRKKIVKPETLVRRDENRWVRAGRVHGLFEAALGASASGVRASPETGSSGESASKTPAQETEERTPPPSKEPEQGGPIEEHRVWSGEVDEEPADEPEQVPLLDLGLKIEEPTSLKDQPRPPLPIPDPDAPKPAPKPKPSEPVKTPEPSKTTEPKVEKPAEPVPEIRVPDAEGEPAEAEGEPAEAEVEAPLGFSVEQPVSLRDGPRVPVPPPVEKPKEEPAETEAAEPGETNDRAVRRVYLRREASARAIGLLFYFQAVVLLLFIGSWTGRVLESLKNLKPGPEVRVLQISILHEGTMLLAGTTALFVMGAGLRMLREWGRWVSAALMAQTALGSLVLLATLALIGLEGLAPAAYLIVVAGVTVPLWTLFVVLAPRSEVVFSASYRELVVRTRGVRRPVAWVELILFVLELAALGYLGWRTWQG